MKETLESLNKKPIEVGEDNGESRLEDETGINLDKLKKIFHNKILKNAFYVLLTTAGLLNSHDSEAQVRVKIKNTPETKEDNNTKLPEADSKKIIYVGGEYLSSKTPKSDDRYYFPDIYKYYDNQVRELIDIVESPAYLTKLESEFTDGSAKKIQQQRLDNIINMDYDITTGIHGFRSAYVETIKDGHVIDRKTFLNLDTIKSKDGFHEIIHQSTAGTISEKCKKMLTESFFVNFDLKNFYTDSSKIIKDYSERSKLYIEHQNYFNDIAERYDRLEIFRLQSMKLLSKNYGDKFTNDDLEKMLIFYYQGKLDVNSLEFIETTNNEKIVELLNSIA